MAASETEYQRLERLFNKRYNMRGSDLAFMLRNDGQSLSRNIAGTWASRGSIGDSIHIISDTFFWSYGFIYGRSEQMWRDDVLKAQSDLRQWARGIDMSRMTVGERFVAVWEKWGTLIPMREDVWAVLTYMAEFVTPKYDPNQPVHIDTWLRCRNGQYQPGRVQIDGAASLTGLPNRWWYTGNSALLRKMSPEEIETYETKVIGNNYDIYDVQAALNEFGKATV